MVVQQTGFDLQVKNDTDAGFTGIARTKSLHLFPMASTGITGTKRVCERNLSYCLGGGHDGRTL